MSHQDQACRTSLKSSELLKVMQWLLHEIVFEKKLHMNCTWTFRSLAMTALFWAWSRESTLTERFACGQRLARFLQPGESGKATSPQAFMEILRRHTDYLVELLLRAFRKRMKTMTTHWKTFGYVVFGVDGTDVAVPRTQANQAAFTSDGKSRHQKRTRIKNQTAHQKKQKECPRILMTTLFHISLGLPWAWRLGSKSDSERGQLLSMLGELPRQSLIVADAGFIGFEFLSAVLASGTELVVRVGSNVKLLKQLGRARESQGIVYIWPDWVLKKDHPPLKFRLVVLTGGKQPVYLITSVLSNKQLTDRQVAQLYRMRWDIELYHRNLKQTYGKNKMLSRSPENARVELNWNVLGYAAMMLYAADQMLDHGVDINRSSPVKIIRVFRKTARDYQHEIEPGQTIDDQIRSAVKDEYKRRGSKDSRDYPRKRKHKSPGKPKILQATNQQKLKAKQLRNQSLAA